MSTTLTPERHLENLTRHIELVKDACNLAGRKLIESGRVEFGRALVARGFIHDNSKFFGIEWDYLHAGQSVPNDALQLAIRQHVLSNDHHPEFWGGIHNMSEISVYEMVCDWLARSQEFGTGLRDWVEESAIVRFKIHRFSLQWAYINKCMELLLEQPFSAVSVH